MKIIVFSDTHGNRSGIEALLHLHADADAFIFLGDGISVLDDFSVKVPFYSVGGNCDVKGKRELLLELGGNRLWCTHGHEYGVKRDLQRIIYAGESRKADIILFGHTHIPVYLKMDDVAVYNPGSLTIPKGGSTKGYGILWLFDEEHKFERCEL